MLTHTLQKLGLALLLKGAMTLHAAAGNVAYIHGDVAPNGNVPSGSAAPFHQMLLTDTGARGMSQYAAAVRGQGHTIGQYYDQATNMNRAFLDQFDVVVFGLHQKIWSGGEKSALDGWIRDGGSILIYSDSASGGNFQFVGIANNTGQTAVNNILTQYGMQVTVDLAGGTRAYRPDGTSSNPIVQGNPIFEGEGVSPVAVDRNAGVEVLYPFEDTFKVSGSNNLNIKTQGITINNPRYAALAWKSVGSGKVMAQFDRQPMWNNGEGSSIQRRDNLTIQTRIINFLAGNGGNNGGSFQAGITISLQGSNGKFVSSENGNGGMTCNRNAVGAWEKFTVGNGSNGTFTLQGNNGKFVSSENGNQAITCNRNAVGGWERFTVTVNGNELTLKGNNGEYVSSENGTQPMNCNRGAVGAWERFTWKVE